MFSFLTLVISLAIASLSEATDSGNADTASSTRPEHLLLRRRSLKKVSFDLPDLPQDVDWLTVLVAVVMVWLVLTCVCSVLQAVCCRSCDSRRRRRAEYIPLAAGNNHSRSLYYNEPPPPAYNPNYRANVPVQRDNTCRNLLWAACCFECCCRDNQDVDCCEVCCCLFAFELCCPREQQY